MSQAKYTIDNVFFSAALAALLFIALAGPSYAEEGKSRTSSHGTWNLSFGGEQVKGSGVMKEETRAVANFSRLTLAFPATLTLAQGAAESLTITADDNLLPLISTEVSGDELVIKHKQSIGFSSNRDIRMRLTVKTLSAIAIKGSGDIVGDQLKTDRLAIVIAGSGDLKFKSLRADPLTIEIKGSGDVMLDAVESKSVDATILGSGDVKLPSLEAKDVKIAIKGSGDVKAAGNADTIDIQIAGHGDVDTRNLVTRDATVKILASGDVTVHAKEKLVASVYGSGDVRYAGSPASVSKTVRGSGTIEPARGK